MKHMDVSERTSLCLCMCLYSLCVLDLEEERGRGRENGVLQECYVVTLEQISSRMAWSRVRAVSDSSKKHTNFPRSTEENPREENSR